MTATAAPDVQVLRITAREIELGDYLPPQPALHGMCWRELGFQVGTQAGFSVRDRGRIELRNRGGNPASLGRYTAVTVHRAA